MIVLPSVPSSRADPVEHADYLELLALLEEDRSASIHDLGRDVAQPGGLGELPQHDDGESEEYPSDRGGERVQELTRVATEEIERRIDVCGGHYPFDLDKHGVLEAKEDVELSVYIFLLLLTVRSATNIDSRERRLFEELSTEVAVAYLGGGERVVKQNFGFPRKSATGFLEALRCLCERIGEGAVQSGAPRIADQKDGGVDLVAVKRFPDCRIGQLVMFGQCATGQDWRDKLSDLQPRVFMNLWMREQLAVEPIKAFFVPVAVEDNYWRDVAMKAGIPFDRTRIVYHSARLPVSLLQEIQDRNTRSLASLRNG